MHVCAVQAFENEQTANAHDIKPANTEFYEQANQGPPPSVDKRGMVWVSGGTWARCPRTRARRQTAATPRARQRPCHGRATEHAACRAARECMVCARRLVR